MNRFEVRRFSASRKPPSSRAGRCAPRRVEALERRQLLTGALPNIVMVSATTVDSKSVTIDYTIENAAIDRPITFGVYRSADTQVDATAVPAGTVTAFDPSSAHPTLDQAGQPATAVGTHQVTLPLAGGLPLNPSHPYIVVSADPQNAIAETSKADNTASFRTYVIGVITHGGVQPMSWKSEGPPWVQMMSVGLRKDGYDAVIPYNWVVDSNHAGRAAWQGPRLAREVIEAASKFPPNDPIDIQFIGHSEGVVVNTQAILYLQAHATPPIRAGYLQETMLDPHAANNGVPGQQYSVSNGILGQIARMEIDHFQSQAKDPPIVVPANVDAAEVFYQHTPVGETHTSNDGMYNLWGQVPVRGPASYFNLTAPGISHAGTFGVMDWYRANVVPTLGSGDGFVTSSILTVSPGPTSAAGTRGRAAVSSSSTPTYAGTAAPGSTVQLIAARANSSRIAVIGRAVTAADGTWSLTTSPLAPGAYRLKAVANVPSPAGQRPLDMTPTAWPSPLIVAPGG